MNNQEIFIRESKNSDKEWIVKLLKEHWGSTSIVSIGKLHDASALPAFLAIRNDQLVGMITNESSVFAIMQNMFTGIITHLGKVTQKTSNRLQIKIDSSFAKKLSNGMSIAVNGICLTVVSFDKNSFEIDFMPETAKRTTIGFLKKHNLVNLELPATIETFLAGHIVQGHVDAVGKIIAIKKAGNSRMFTFSISRESSKYIVEKGSITVNGISLTVSAIGKDYFTVGIIPHTWEKTMLHTAKEGDFVNLEVDVLAKYLEKLIKTK